jgi:membrane protein YdbS with pleckstrin-like domain
VFRASPRFLALKLTTHFASLGAALAFELVAALTMPSGGQRLVTTLASGLVLGSTLLLLVVRYFLLRLDYDMRFYVLTDRSLRIRRGALTIEESTYTFANVQNLSLRQGPLERLFGVTNLHVETAGGGAAEASGDAGHGMFHRGRLEGIEPVVAERLRDRIRRLVAHYQGAGLGDDATRPHATTHAGGGLRAAAHVDCLRRIAAELRAARKAVGG